MHNQCHLSIRNDFNQLVESIAKVNDFLGSHLLPSRTIYNVNLVFEETVTNIVKYAFDDEHEHEIRIFIIVGDTNIVLEFTDDGYEFNPLSAPPPDMAPSLLESREGGLGMHLVKQAVEWIEYHRVNNQNVLRMSIKLGPETELLSRM